MKNYSEYFETRKRNDKNFVCCKDEVPQELKDLIRDIHMNHFSGALPNDWIYRVIMEAFEELETEKLDDISIEADCYYGQLYEWFGNPYAHEYCNEAIECDSPAKDIYAIISLAQYLSKRNIYESVNQFMEGKENE